jgi:hypothetical protein
MNVEAGGSLLYLHESHPMVEIVMLSTVDVHEARNRLPIEHHSAPVRSSQTHRNSQAQPTEQVDACFIDNCQNEDEDRPKKPCLGTRL